jgi:hypothetical protein
MCWLLKAFGFCCCQPSTVCLQIADCFVCSVPMVSTSRSLGQNYSVGGRLACGRGVLGRQTMHNAGTASLLYPHPHPREANCGSGFRCQSTTALEDRLIGTTNGIGRFRNGPMKKSKVPKINLRARVPSRHRHH